MMIQGDKDTKGKEDWEARLYYPGLKAAVEGLGELMVRQSKADTLVDALAAIENIATALSQAVTPKIEGLEDLSRTGTG